MIMRSAKKRTRGLNGWPFDPVLPSSNVLSTTANVPEDMDDWDCGMWKLYYQKMKAAKGKQYAIDTLEIDSGRVGMFADLQWCKGDCDFINYFKSEGVPTGNFITDLYCGTGEVISTVTGAVVDVAQGAGAVAKGASNTAKTLGLILPIIVLGGGGLVLYRYYKHGKIV